MKGSPVAGALGVDAGGEVGSGPPVMLLVPDPVPGIAWRA